MKGFFCFSLLSLFSFLNLYSVSSAHGQVGFQGERSLLSQVAYDRNHDFGLGVDIEIFWTADWRPKLLSLENPFEFNWNLKWGFEIWKFNLNLKKTYPVWKFISNMDFVEIEVFGIRKLLLKITWKTLYADITNINVCPITNSRIVIRPLIIWDIVRTTIITSPKRQ